MEHPLHSALKVFVLRLKPGEDLKRRLIQFASDNRIRAGIIMTCVGSLRQTHLRFANRDEGAMQQGFAEILSLQGTLSGDSAHLHLSVADSTGNSRGGHLLDGNLVYTTAEVVIGQLTELVFHRVHDPDSGYPELGISRL